jgi:hypothetical protein
METKSRKIYIINNKTPTTTIEHMLKGKFQVINSQEKGHLSEHADFDLNSLNKFKKYLPNYAPTLFGVGQKGKIFFLIPGVPGENSYLKQFLESFLRRASSLLKDS